MAALAGRSFSKALSFPTDKQFERPGKAGLRMKVNDPNISALTSDTVGGAGLDRARQAEQIQRRSTGGAGPAAGESPDSVSLSGLSSQIRALNIDSPERIQQLEKLSADVGTNKYQVDAHELSDRLVEDAIRPKV